MASEHEIIGKLRALGLNREADALMHVYLAMSRMLAENNMLTAKLREAKAVLKLLAQHRNDPEGLDEPIPSDLLNREYALIGDEIPLPEEGQAP